MTKEEIKSRMKHLARKFCRRNNVYKEFDGSVGKLIEKSYLSAYLLCLHESKNKIAELEKENAELKEKVGTYQIGMFDEIEKRDRRITKAKELLAKWVALYKPKTDVLPPTSIQIDTEQFLKEIEK